MNPAAQPGEERARGGRAAAVRPGQEGARSSLLFCNCNSYHHYYFITIIICYFQSWILCPFVLPICSTPRQSIPISGWPARAARADPTNVGAAPQVGRKIALQRGRRAVVLCVVDAADFDGSLPRAALAGLFSTIEDYQVRGPGRHTWPGAPCACVL